MGQDGIICDYVGFWIGFNKGVNIIDDVDMVFWNTAEGMGTNNWIFPAHGAPIRFSVIGVGGGRIP